MDTGLLVLRIVVGLVLVGHGAQKLFGSFGGAGLSGTSVRPATGLRASWPGSPEAPNSSEASASPPVS